MLIVSVISFMGNNLKKKEKKIELFFDTRISVLCSNLSGYDGATFYEICLIITIKRLIFSTILFCALTILTNL